MQIIHFFIDNDPKHPSAKNHSDILFIMNIKSGKSDFFQGQIFELSCFAEK
jgi:hypothetical protein